MRYTALSFMCTLGSLVLADVKINVPAAGAIIPAGTVTVTWTESGTGPTLASLTSYTMQLFSGTNASPVALRTLSPGGTLFGTTPTIAVTVDPGAGNSTTNAYFIGMTSVIATGGTVINYSDRFTLTGMTGVFPADVIAALPAVVGAAGPAGATHTPQAAPAAGATAADQWAIPYPSQTGLTKYAPMQPPVGSAITATVTDRLWPTSGFSIAHTFLVPASQVTTLTQPVTYAVSSHANTVAGAALPTDAMQRFLNRWRD